MAKKKNLSTDPTTYLGQMEAKVAAKMPSSRSKVMSGSAAPRPKIPSGLPKALGVPKNSDIPGNRPGTVGRVG